MAEETPLAPFVQISDLHFREPPLRPLHQVHARLVNFFPGLMGHDLRALDALHRMMVELEPESPRLIVTGDVTQAGRDAQFDLVQQFLQGPAQPS